MECTFTINLTDAVEMILFSFQSFPIDRMILSLSVFFVDEYESLYAHVISYLLRQDIPIRDIKEGLINIKY